MSELLQKLGYDSAPLHRTSGGVLIVLVRVNDGETLRFRCDTGASTTFLFKAPATGGTLAGTDRPMSRMASSVESFQVGEVLTSWRSLMVGNFSLLKIADFEHEHIDGVLGNDWMLEHKAIVDVANARLFFSANPSKSNLENLV